MKYFAKYLTVKGEIKKGESYLTEDVIIKESIVDWTLADMGAMHVQKVRLFICTKDVRLGDVVQRDTRSDTFKDEGPVYHVEYKESHFLSEDKDIYYVSTKIGGMFIIEGEAIRVIGRISPGAAWVNEGDEFEEEDCSFVWSASEDSKGWFEVRCPTCKIFH
jgi:hypothetical protein